MAVEAEGDRPVTREEVVELADAVADAGGIASGIGTNRYGAQLVVEADHVRSLPSWRQRNSVERHSEPRARLAIVSVAAISETEDVGEDPRGRAG